MWERTLETTQGDRAVTTCREAEGQCKGKEQAAPGSNVMLLGGGGKQTPPPEGSQVAPEKGWTVSPRGQIHSSLEALNPVGDL